jgi:GNAT superfamily N-acetyltransferase
MKDLQIDNLSKNVALIPLLARWHHQQWGELTGASSIDDYINILSKHASSKSVPLTLLAINGGTLLGSVNIVESDLVIRHELTPWLAQLYVPPEQRNKGIGSALVAKAIFQASELGYEVLYLYTSGSLPDYYEVLGWTIRETLTYKGKIRTVMEIKVPVNQSLKPIAAPWAAPA